MFHIMRRRERVKGQKEGGEEGGKVRNKGRGEGVWEAIMFWEGGWEMATRSCVLLTFPSRLEFRRR